MNNTYLPGPWHVNGVGYRRDDSSPTGRRCYLTSPDGVDAEKLTINARNHHIATLDSHRRLADARLMAAAPDLLSVVIQAVEAAGFSLSGPTDSRAAEDGEPAWVCSAREVIARATVFA